MDLGMREERMPKKLSASERRMADIKRRIENYEGECCKRARNREALRIANRDWALSRKADAAGLAEACIIHRIMAVAIRAAVAKRRKARGKAR